MRVVGICIMFIGAIFMCVGHPESHDTASPEFIMGGIIILVGVALNLIESMR